MEILRRLHILGLSKILYEHGANAPVVETDMIRISYIVWYEDEGQTTVQGWTRICYATKEKELDELLVRHSHYLESEEMVTAVTALDEIYSVTRAAMRRYCIGSGYYINLRKFPSPAHIKSEH